MFSIVVNYNVGSRDERKGRTGFAHLFEHMMFKGSQNVGPGEHPYLLFMNGGNMNGTTELEDRDGLPAQADALRKLGHQVQVRRHEGGLTALRRTAEGWEGGADPRRDGAAKGE